LRTKIAISTIGLLITLPGCGGGDSTTGGTTTGSGGHGGGATTTGASGMGGASGTGGAATSTGSLNPGGAQFGATCTKNGDCASLLCVDVDQSHAVCTKPCANDAACPPAPEWSCATKGGGSQAVCLCQPSGEDICDGQDNNCDGVVDEGGCPELIHAASGPIADLKLAGDKLVFVTDKTIEKVALTPGSAPVVLRNDTAGVEAIATSATSIGWVQGTFRKMDFLGNAAPEVAIAVTPPVKHVLLNDTVAYYSDAVGIHVFINNINKQLTWYGGPPGDMLLANNTIYWYNSSQVTYSLVSGQDKPGTVIAKNQPAPLFLASDGNALYWAGAEGKIRKVAPPSYNSVDELITGEPGITGLAADATNVYWATSDSLTSTLWKLPLAGGAKAKIGGVTGTARHLIPSGNHVYFETGKLIWRSPT
jgi:hypothetical protein